MSMALASRQHDPGVKSSNKSSDVYLRQQAATTIQRYFRGFLVRRAYLQHIKARNEASSAWKQATALSNLQDLAARQIQNSWRSFRNRRIYRYYRDLIQFRERGDPKELLRCINPREAQLADAASGIHVRFRLGGTTYPPLVFYKIATHRPVADINAFGPRDYANEVRTGAAEVHNWSGGLRCGANSSSSSTNTSSTAVFKLQADSKKAGKVASTGGAAPALHSRAHGRPAEGYTEFALDASLREYTRPDGSKGLRSTMGWYERFENNGWRPISERVLVGEDPITTATRLKRMPIFHHDPAQRRQDRALMAKQRKREWLLKMYKEGLMGHTNASGTQEASDSPAWDDPELDLDGLGGSPEDLLAWSNHLDFDTYMNDWTSLACTMGSEAFSIPQDDALSDYLPVGGGVTHGLDIGRVMAAAGAPLQPFKGGLAAAGTTSTMHLL